MKHPVSLYRLRQKSSPTFAGAFRMRFQVQWSHGTRGVFSDIAETDDAAGVTVTDANIAVGNAWEATEPAAVREAAKGAVERTHQWIKHQRGSGGIPADRLGGVSSEDFILGGKPYRIDVENWAGWNLRK